jgi:hypothetical protein
MKSDVDTWQGWVGYDFLSFGQKLMGREKPTKSRLELHRGRQQQISLNNPPKKINARVFMRSEVVWLAQLLKEQERQLLFQLTLVH